MREVTVIGDGAKPLSEFPSTEDILELTTVEPEPNIRLQVDVFRKRFHCELPKRLDDLLRLAAFIFSADTRISRGSEKDVFAKDWSRTFRMVLPVWDLSFWEVPAVKEALVEALFFLTGDTFFFEFVQRYRGEDLQRIFQFKDATDLPPLDDVVVMFSGGADSLAAVLEAIKEGLHPVLASHRPVATIDRRQRDLVNLLRDRFKDRAFPHLNMWVNRLGGDRTKEFSQRSRSFLFTSLGVATAALLNIDEVRLCDNGVVSINLPQSGQNSGTFLSRSTHPRFLERVERFMRLVTECDSLRIRNTLLFKTKREVLEIIAESGYPELLQETISCAHTEGKTKLQPHCGVCSQCIDRRFASVAADLVEHDLPTRYEKNIFISALNEGIERTHAENYARFASRLESIKTPDQFFGDFAELIDCLPAESDVDAFGTAVWELFQRHQENVNGVLEKQLTLHLQDLRQASLPENCLLRMVISGLHKVDARISFIDQLRTLLKKGIPPAFQTHKAKDERQVQDVADGIFQTARLTLERESPQIPFGVITTKPDYAKTDDGSTPLFVEFKYVRNRNRLNGIVTEMTSRVTIYADQGAWILFIVYDPARAIQNDERFAASFTRHEGVWVEVVR